MLASNKPLYRYLQAAGFHLIFKPTIAYKQGNALTYKGNVDAELVLHVSAIEYHNYDQALIVTSDGDCSCLMQFLINNQQSITESR